MTCPAHPRNVEGGGELDGTSVAPAFAQSRGAVVPSRAAPVTDAFTRAHAARSSNAADSTIRTMDNLLGALEKCLGSMLTSHERG